jgi:hypothetical protein
MLLTARNVLVDQLGHPFHGGGRKYELGKKKPARTEQVPDLFDAWYEPVVDQLDWVDSLTQSSLRNLQGVLRVPLDDDIYSALKNFS